MFKCFRGENARLTIDLRVKFPYKQFTLLCESLLSSFLFAKRQPPPVQGTWCSILCSVMCDPSSAS